MNKSRKINLFLIIYALSLVMISFFPGRVNAENSKLTKIMGTSDMSSEQMANYLFLGNDENGINPIDYKYAKEFAEETINEAEAEGVRADVAFALMMHETGFLNFTGDITPEQNNFGGLGATGGGEKGQIFLNRREGIRAVVQHLKCYASTEPLNQKMIDPRWDDSLRGKARYVEHLGYKDNPYKKGWAYPGDGYGKKVLLHLKNAEKYTDENVGERVKEKQERVSADQRFDVLKNSPVLFFVIAIAVGIGILLLYLSMQATKKNIERKNK